jgi:hypothetical protein
MAHLSDLIQFRTQLMPSNLVVKKEIHEQNEPGLPSVWIFMLLFSPFKNQ